jgi:carbohydrate kinase (thermoresistant glucokinase family)
MSAPMKNPVAVVVMGVAGSGKTTVGAMIAGRLGVEFIEGDQLHPAANVEKMAAGTPLTDDDRWPWLAAIGMEIGRRARAGKGVVAGCSALRRAYRDLLREKSGADPIFVYLSGSRELIGERMKLRTGHFFPPSLLESQFGTLEPPEVDERHIVADLRLPLDEMIGRVVREIEATRA